MVPSESAEGGALLPKKRSVEALQPSRKRFTTAKERREHLNKSFRNQDWNNDSRERQKVDDMTSNEPKEPRKPKKKVAVLVGFCGTGYQGMQMYVENTINDITALQLKFCKSCSNRNAKTIEEDLFKAFIAAGAVSKDNSDDPKKVRNNQFTF